MKVQILQENLNKGLNIASRSISSKAQLPILANVLLKTDKNRLLISATNLDTGISLWLGAKIEKEGEITIPAKMLTELISSLPAEKIDLEVKENSLKISCNGFDATLNGISASEFPKLPVYEPEKLFSFPSEKLLDAITQVAFSAATDEGRPVLTGVLFKLHDKTLSLVATDGYRLSLKEVVLENSAEKDLLLLLPAKTLLEIGRIIGEEGKESKNVQMSFTKEQNQVVFVFPDLELFSRVIEGDFPDYSKIIPKELTTKAVLDREGLNRAVKVVSLFARDSSNIVKLNFGKNILKLSANSPQLGENENSIESKTEGEDVQIAFNFRFLQNFLSSVSGAEVTIETNGPLSPGVFKSAEDKTFMHIIMPVRLQSEENNQ